MLKEHTDEILQGLGYTPEAITQRRQNRIVSQLGD